MAGLDVNTRTISVEHVTIPSQKPFESVKAALERLVPRIHGLQQKAIQYDIGNPLTASRMTEHQLSAALYAPIRVLLRESPEEGVVAFEYDRPASVFGQFNNADVNTVAEERRSNRLRLRRSARRFGYPYGQLVNSGEKRSQNGGCIRLMISDDQIDGRRLAFQGTTDD